MSAIEDLISDICTSRKGSIGSINNVYLPQLDVKYVEEAAADLAQLRSDLDKKGELEEALRGIYAWCRAYPLKVFPEPDFKRVQKLLEAGGITLDSVSASNMRHVVKGIEKIAADALQMNGG